MASLVTDEDKHGFTGMLADHFDTFKQEIVVFKAPVKVLQNVTSNDSYAGYGESSNQQEFEYVSVSGVYNAIVNYNNPEQMDVGDDIGNIMIARGTVRIKVEQDARDFILNGSSTEAIKIDGNTYNKVTDDSVQNYLGLKYYVFYLEKTD
jgi:hypothetical protein|tara:strand:- start:335 stop:784 length:450 start_codon:yes stop_codon:yes gene_type:complete